MPMSTRRECSPSWVWSDSCGVTEVPRAHWPPNAFTLYIFYNMIRICPDRRWWPYKRSVAICRGLYVQLYMSISDQSLYAYIGLYVQAIARYMYNRPLYICVCMCCFICIGAIARYTCVWADAVCIYEYVSTCLHAITRYMYQRSLANACCPKRSLATCISDHSLAKPITRCAFMIAIIR